MKCFPVADTTASGDSKRVEDDCTLASSSSDYGGILKRIEANANGNQARLLKFVGARPPKQYSFMKGSKVSQSVSSSSSKESSKASLSKLKPSFSGSKSHLPREKETKLTKQCSFPAPVSCFSRIVGGQSKDSHEQEHVFTTKSTCSEKRVTFLSDIVAKSSEIEALDVSYETKDSSNWRKLIKERMKAPAKENKEDDIEQEEIEDGLFHKVKEKIDHDVKSQVRVSFAVPKTAAISTVHTHKEEQHSIQTPKECTVPEYRMPPVKIIAEQVIPKRRNKEEPPIVDTRAEAREETVQSSKEEPKESYKVPLTNISVDMERARSTNSELTHRTFASMPEDKPNWLDFVDLWLNGSSESWTTEMNTFTLDDTLYD